MARDVHSFRRLKWGDPQRKLKVLSEDFRPRASRAPRRRLSVPALLSTVTLVGAFGIGYTADTPVTDRLWAALPGTGCNIKGNISQNTGERIYHVPGQRYYEMTVISPRYGERWFCNEDEARRAGWRKSRT